MPTTQTAKKGLSATALGAATINDPQFKIPELPCMVPGLVLLWTAEGLIIEGISTRKVLQGTSAKSVLPVLIPLLDGTRSWTKLGDETGLPYNKLRAVLALLFSCGALQDGPLTLERPLTASDAYLARALDSTRVNKSLQDAHARISNHNVHVIGPTDVAHQLAEELSALNFRFSDTVQDSDFLVLFATPSNLENLQAAGDIARREGRPVLLAGVNGGVRFIGPLVTPDYGPCLNCCLAELDLDDWPEGPDSLIHASLTAVEAIQIMTRTGTSAAMRGHVTLDIPKGKTANKLIPARPGCPTCGSPETELHPAPLGYEYELSVEFPPRRFVNPRDHQSHFEPSNVALQFDSPPSKQLRRVDLPESNPAVPGNQEGLTLTALARLLRGGFGLKERATEDANGKVRRWAPTGGNLGSPKAYVLNRSLAGLDPGVYQYSAFEHALVQLSPVTETVPEAVNYAPAELILTGSITKVAKKYRTFSYRVIHLDAGVALANIASLAASDGVALTNARNWNEQALLAQLNVHPQTETVTARVLLGDNA